MDNFLKKCDSEEEIKAFIDDICLQDMLERLNKTTGRYVPQSNTSNNRTSLESVSKLVKRTYFNKRDVINMNESATLSTFEKFKANKSKRERIANFGTNHIIPIGIHKPHKHYNSKKIAFEISTFPGEFEYMDHDYPSSLDRSRSPIAPDLYETPTGTIDLYRYMNLQNRVRPGIESSEVPQYEYDEANENIDSDNSPVSPTFD